MIAYLICLLPLQGTAEVTLPGGAPIQFDGAMADAEWADAKDLTQRVGRTTLRLAIKRTGAWLAVGMHVNRDYGGEVLTLNTAAEDGAWIVAMFLGIGHPALPPAFWRRGPPDLMQTKNLPPQCPRGVRVRLRVKEPGSWSAEYLIRLATLGIGRADGRRFRIALALAAPPSRDRVRYIELPRGLADWSDPTRFALMLPGGGWGDEEQWGPVSTEISKEFDDNELLMHLAMANAPRDPAAAREGPPVSDLFDVVRHRSEKAIRGLQARIEEGRRRNPTLTAWDYFIADLLHQANFREEARKIEAALPKHIAELEPFVHLVARHHIDRQDCESAIDLCVGIGRDVPGAAQLGSLAQSTKMAIAAEKRRIAADDAKKEQNPRVRITTQKGVIELELFEDDAKRAVHNFMGLVADGFYDKLTFHAVRGGSGAQTGDPRTRPGSDAKVDGPGWRLKGDDTQRPMLRGYVAVIPAGEESLHGSQFVISVSPMLNPGTLVFGRVIAGLDIVERLEEGDRIESIQIIAKRNHGYDPLDSRLR